MEFIKGDQPAVSSQYILCQQEIIGAADTVIRHHEGISQDHNAAVAVRKI